jgi:hypothetical protein
MTENEPGKKAKIDLPDIMLFIGLVLLFVGLGFAISWPVAAAVSGAVLIGLAIWLVEPSKSNKGVA